MKWLLTLLVVAAFLYPRAAGSVTQYTAGRSASKGVSVTLSDPIGSVYRAGEEVGVSLRTDSDAYVVVFNIDTDGFVHLLYPEDGKSLRKFSGGRVYELPEDPWSSGAPGVSNSSSRSPSRTAITSTNKRYAFSPTTKTFPRRGNSGSRGIPFSAPTVSRASSCAGSRSAPG
jgi:hypothetical protein